VSPPSELIVSTPSGLYCPPGDFYLDPWRPVPRAVLTHAHSDHARPGSQHYLAQQDALPILRTRLGAEASIQGLAYGEAISINGVRVSLHPAGHVLGSAQVRLEHQGQVWVLSGDYKLQADPTCPPFEPLRCDVFVTESTFGLPIYRWQHPAAVAAQLNAWWAANAEAGVVSVVYAYAFGKAQRLLAMLDPGIGPVHCHGAVEALNAGYEAAGMALPARTPVPDLRSKDPVLRRALVIAPPSAQATPWLKRFGATHRDAFASGWMQVRGARRRRGVDLGLVLSDHADWPGLLDAIRGTQAPRVIVTHGAAAPLIRHLQEQGLDAGRFATEYGNEEGNA
jgi:putative mRNA 3-end processing factor